MKVMCAVLLTFFNGRANQTAWVGGWIDAQDTIFVMSIHAKGNRNHVNISLSITE